MVPPSVYHCLSLGLSLGFSLGLNLGLGIGFCLGLSMVSYMECRSWNREGLSELLLSLEPMFQNFLCP
jgi:hypothetical protein